MIADDGRARDAIIETLSLAFAQDPAMSWMVPDTAARRRMLPSFFDHVRREDLAAGVVEASQAGEVAALWRSPGKHRLEPLGAMRTALAFVTVLRTGLFRGKAIADSLKRHHPPGDHWHLRFIGVRPDAQGKGWGGKALRHGIERAERDAVPIYLETATPDNVGLYQRFGFVIADEWDIPRGGPQFWGMMRPVGG